MRVHEGLARVHVRVSALLLRAFCVLHQAVQRSTDMVFRICAHQHAACASHPMCATQCLLATV